MSRSEQPVTRFQAMAATGRILAGVVAILVFAFILVQIPRAGAGALLYPVRTPVTGPAPPGCEATAFEGADVNLAGWRCPAARARRGSVIYLHGVGDNRRSGAGVIERFRARGFDVVAYDSRAHGDSGGDVCTYGFYEKDDLRKVIDTLAEGPVVLIGTSLGAAVALQHAARDERVSAVVAAESFSDLRTIASERAPFIFPSGFVDRALTLAEEIGEFQVDAVSPALAALAIRSPVLVIHGAADVDTSPDHARRVFASLAGPKRLILVPGGQHSQALRAEVWVEIESWLDAMLGLHAG